MPVARHLELFPTKILAKTACVTSGSVPDRKHPVGRTSEGKHRRSPFNLGRVAKEGKAIVTGVSIQPSQDWPSGQPRVPAGDP